MHGNPLEPKFVWFCLLLILFIFIFILLPKTSALFNEKYKSTVPPRRKFQAVDWCRHHIWLAACHSGACSVFTDGKDGIYGQFVHRSPAEDGSTFFRHTSKFVPPPEICLFPNAQIFPDIAVLTYIGRFPFISFSWSKHVNLNPSKLAMCPKMQ